MDEPLTAYRNFNFFIPLLVFKMSFTNADLEQELCVIFYFSTTSMLKKFPSTITKYQIFMVMQWFRSKFSPYLFAMWWELWQMADVNLPMIYRTLYIQLLSFWVAILTGCSADEHTSTIHICVAKVHRVHDSNDILGIPDQRDKLRHIIIGILVEQFE